MEIRPYQTGDKEQVIQLWIDCGLVAPQNNPARDIARKLQHQPHLFLVGEREGQVVATCMAGYEGHRGWINYLAVAPLLQRKGYARQMMDHAEQLLRDAGCPKINLQIRTSNTRVIDFYKALGYVPDQVISMGKRLVVDEPKP